MDIDRATYLQWSKDRALEHAQMGDLENAIASMISDLKKHPQTAPNPAAERALTVAILFHRADKRKVIEWINGFK